MHTRGRTSGPLRELFYRGWMPLAFKVISNQIIYISKPDVYPRKCPLFLVKSRRRRNLPTKKNSAGSSGLPNWFTCFDNENSQSERMFGYSRAPLALVIADACSDKSFTTIAIHLILIRVASGINTT